MSRNYWSNSCNLVPRVLSKREDPGNEVVIVAPLKFDVLKTSIFVFEASLVVQILIEHFRGPIVRQQKHSLFK